MDVLITVPQRRLGAVATSSTPPARRASARRGGRGVGFLPIRRQTSPRLGGVLVRAALESMRFI